MQSFLIDCKRVEEIACKIYQLLADNESYASEVRKVFQKMSDDERAHVRHIDLVLQANEKEFVATQMIPEQTLGDALKNAELLLCKVEREDLNEETSLRLAVHLEKEFAKVHINNALFFRNPKLADLFDKLGKEDEEHLNTLKDCLEWWQVERKKILSEN
jgi:rubrerythrin